jgi:phosphatidate cytidylyltransferase
LNLLKRILTAIVLIPIVLLLVLSAPVWALALVTLLVALLATQELLKLAEGYGIQPLTWPTYVFSGVFFLLFVFLPKSGSPLFSTAIFVYTAAFAAAIAPFLFLVIGMRRAQLSTAFPAASLSVFAFAYIALPLGLLVQLREQWAGAFLLVFLLLAVWAGDMAAYFVGRTVGRHLMSPRVSPKKTWEGALGSLLASLLVGYLWFDHALSISSALLQAHLIGQKDGLFALQKQPLWITLLLALAVNVAAQLGDLVESLIKRGARVKDSGAILPGHGGMLDRIDALLMAAPVLWYYAAWRVLR